MKKLLALVLALVMTLGLATVAANASYPDDSDIEFKEAVDVMSAVGVFQGDESGKFMPKANLDRAAAAKLIAYLDLGEKSAEALPAAKMFNDVPASHWAAKYIAYCANAGYIAGAGDGNFYPSNPLTGYAFGKMILCVLGYDAAIEGFTGAAWAINVAKLMDKNDINDGVDGNASATLTREQAAKYCLNALQADMVEYDTKGTTVEINGAKIATGASKATVVAEKKDMYDTKDDGVQQLTEKLYGTDLKLVNNVDSDDFNAPAVQWKYKNDTVGTYADTPDAVYNNKVTKGTIYTLLGKSVYDDLNEKIPTAQVKVSVDGGAFTDGANQVDKNNSGAAFGTDNGTLTEVYIDDSGNDTYDTIVTVVVKNTYVMQASDDYNAKTEKLSIDPLSGPYTKATVTDDNVADGVAFDSFEEDDYILYTYAAGTIQSMVKAETLTGKVSGYTSKKNVTIDGTKYSYNVTVDEDKDHGKGVTFKTNEEATLVLDAQGYIIYVDEAVAGNDNVYFVVGYDDGGKIDDERAKVVTVDGKKQTVYLSSKSDDVAEGSVYAFKADGDKVKLTDYSKEKWGTAAAGTYTFYKKTDAIKNMKATADTVYIVEDDEGDITLYTGVKNAPDSVETKDAVMYVNNTDKELLYVYIIAVEDGIEEHSTSDDQLIYVLKKGDAVTDADDNEYIEYVALVDGSEKTLKVDPDAEIKVGGFYTKQKVNSKGIVTGLTAAKDNDDYDTFTVNGDNIFTFSSDVFSAGENSWYVAGTKVHVLLNGKPNNELLDDKNASYELNETTFKGLESFVKGYNVTATGWLVINDDEEATEAFINITVASEIAE